MRILSWFWQLRFLWHLLLHRTPSLLHLHRFVSHLVWHEHLKKPCPPVLLWRQAASLKFENQVIPLKGRHPLPFLLFFYKVYKRPLTPPSFALFSLPKPACTFALLRYSSSSLIVLQPCAQLDGIPEYRNMISTEGKLKLHTYFTLTFSTSDSFIAWRHWHRSKPGSFFEQFFNSDIKHNEPQSLN